MNVARLQLRESHNTLRVVMNANVSTTASDLGLSPVLALVDSESLETPYLAAIDMLRMIADVASPSAKLNIIGMYIQWQITIFRALCREINYGPNCYTIWRNKKA